MRDEQSKNPLGANPLDAKGKASMRTRVISAIIAICAILPCIFIGDWLLFGVATAVLAIGVYEVLHVIHHTDIFTYLCTLICALFIMSWPIFRQLIIYWQNGTALFTHVYSYFSSIYISIIVITVSILALFFLVTVYKDFTVRDACFVFSICVILCLGLQSILFLRYYPLWEITKTGTVPTDGWCGLNYTTTVKSSLLFIYVALATLLTDAGAYFVGIFFGKHKMNERISPKKTWEGFIGGIVFSACISFGLGMLFAGTGNAMASMFDLSHWYYILILSIIIPFIGTLGDFVFSSLKRYYDIKDFGNIMPGHGGVLDRIDSLIFAGLVAAVVISILSGNYLV